MPRKKVKVKVKRKASKTSARKKVAKGVVKFTDAKPTNYLKATKALVKYIAESDNTDRTITFKRSRGVKAFVVPKDAKFKTGAIPNLLSLSVFAVDFSTGKVIKDDLAHSDVQKSFKL